MTCDPSDRSLLSRPGLFRGGLLGLTALLLLLAARPLAPLADEIEQLITSPEGGQALWGIYVQDLSTGRTLYSHNANVPMIPASNQKLITTGAALEALGGDYRYQTTLYFEGEVEGTTMQGDLILEGSGDPTFGSAEIRGRDPLRAWAQSLAAMGVTRFEGEIIGDDDAFDNRPYAEGWDIDYVTSQSSRSIGISAGGLSYGDNVIEVKVRSGGVGDPPIVETRPPGYLTFKNQATTSSRSRGWALDIDRLVGTETVNLTGSLPRSYRGTIFMPVTNPTKYTLHAFRHYLEQAGIEVEAELIDIDDREEELDYEEAEPLFVHLSPPLSEILAVLNKESNNFYAEQVFRSFGWGGSAEGSERRVKDLLSRAGADPSAISIRDGSGLSRKDLITPEAMAKLLAFMYEHSEQEVFTGSLARGGESETTLRYRLSGVPVQAKTGSLEFVRTLSGYAQTPDGRTLAFALFANNYTVPSYRITQMIDRIVRTLTTNSVG